MIDNLRIFLFASLLVVCFTISVMDADSIILRRIKSLFKIKTKKVEI